MPRMKRVNLGAPRAYHDRMAIDALRTARDKLVGTGCSLAQVVKAARLVQMARSHVASISGDSPRDSKRTRHMWVAVGKLERRLTVLVDKCTLDPGHGYR